MTIVKRLVKGSALTHSELDGNFTDLDTRVTTLENTNSDSQTLTLSGTDLIISNGNTVDLSGLVTVGEQGPAGADGADGADGAVGPKGDTGDAGPAGTTDYNLLQNLPTIPADISQLTDNTGIIQAANTDSQTLTLSGTTLQISGGNSVDLAGISGSGTLSGLTDTTVANLQQYQSLQWSGSAWVNSYPAIQHLSDIDRLNNPSNGDTLKWDANDGQFIFAPAAIQYDQDLNTTDDVTFNDITSTGTIQASGTVIANAFEGNLYNTQGQVILDNTAGNEGFGGNISSNGASSFSGTVDFTGAIVTGLSSGTYGDTDVATYLNGNLDTSIIPDTNATYDIGSAEKKVRHFYLSDNSLKFTDTTDPLNIVEYSVGRTGTDITFNGSALKSTSSEDVADAGTIDITKTNHFVTNGTTAVLPDGTYMGQKLEFWRVVGTGVVDINVNSAIYMDGGNTAIGPVSIVWRLGDANQTLYSCIWNEVAWVLSHGGPGV